MSNKDQDKDKNTAKSNAEDEVVLLEDLEPREEVRGAAAKVVFGQADKKDEEE